jgi:hypothetical protein
MAIFDTKGRKEAVQARVDDPPLDTTADEYSTPVARANTLEKWGIWVS